MLLLVCRCRVKVGTLVFTFLKLVYYLIFLHSESFLTVDRQGGMVDKWRAVAGVSKMEGMGTEFECLCDSERSGFNCARLPLQ